MSIPAFWSFEPTNEELVRFLEHKAAGGTGIPSYLPEVNLYSHLPPWDIFPHIPPEKTYREQQWYCLTPLKTKSPKVTERSLSLPGYSWHTTQKPEHLLPTLTKRVFNFLRPKAEPSSTIKSRRTLWSMHEYTLPHYPHLAICRVILRPDPPSTPHPPPQILPFHQYTSMLSPRPMFPSTSTLPPPLTYHLDMPPATSTPHHDTPLATTSTPPPPPPPPQSSDVHMPPAPSPQQQSSLEDIVSFIEHHLSDDDTPLPTTSTPPPPQSSHDHMAPPTSPQQQSSSSDHHDDDDYSLDDFICSLEYELPHEDLDDHAFDFGFQNALMS